MIKKIIDSHLHIEAWTNEEGDFLNAFEPYRNQSKLAALNVCALPSHNGAGNNIMCMLYKLVNPNTYLHGGIVHLNKPISDDAPVGFDPVTQYRELMEIGCDGIKMLEGKPSYHMVLGKDINHPALDRLYTEMEKDGVHVIYHINDPDEFWDRDRAPESAFSEGWFYGDLDYAHYDVIKAQAEKMLENHPNLKVTFAHFFFSSKTPEYLEELFKKYPNVCVDLTPGTEMYDSFEKNTEYYKEFFTKYADRILIGTDATFPWTTKGHVWCMDIITRYLGTNDKMMAFNDKILTGIDLPEYAQERIFYKNFEERVAKSPKPINKSALKAYIEKYKEHLTEEDARLIVPLCEKYL